MAKREIKTKYGQRQEKERAAQNTRAAVNTVFGVTGVVGAVVIAASGAGLPLALASASSGALSFDSANRNKAAAKLAAAKLFAAEHFQSRARPSTSYAPGTGGVPGAPGAPGGVLFNEVNRRAADPADNGVHLWDRVTNAMEMGTLHPKAETFFSPFQTAMRSSLETRGAARAGRAYLNDAAAQKASKSPQPISSSGQRPAAAPPVASNGMVHEYTRRDGTRVQGYHRNK